MADAGYKHRVYIAPDSAGSPGSFDEVDGIENSDINDQIADLDISDSKDQIGAIVRILGLRDTPFTLTGHVEYETGQNSIRTKYAARTLSWVKVLVDGTNGWQCKVWITGIQTRPSTSGKADLTVQLKSTGVAAALP